MVDTFDAELEAFAADRRPRLDELVALLRPLVATALTRADQNRALATVAAFAYDRAGGTDPARYLADIDDAIAHTHIGSDVNLVATWIATSAFGAAAYYGATPGSTKTWLTMLDDDVRDTHEEQNRTTIPLSESFDLDGVPSRYPGEPVGPLDRWINCRCSLFVRSNVTAGGADMDETLTAAVPVIDDDWLEEMLADDDEFDPDGEFPPIEMDDEAPMPWHSVMTVEGVPSGDRRGFGAGSLTWRDLPLPLEWQDRTADRHDGSVVVGRIEGIKREGNEIRAWGYFTDNSFADDLIGLVAERTLRGISPTIDSVEASFDEQTQTETTDAGRICSATMVNIPAFAEAFLALGPPPREWGFHLDGDNSMPVVETTAAGSGVGPAADQFDDDYDDYRQRDAEQRRRLAEKGHALPDGSFPIADLEDLRNAIQAIGRAKNPSVARAHIKKRARALGHPELIPDNWAAETEQFARGRGWVTHPRETRRLHAYWTRGAGARKIGWGSPHDFYRCRRQLAKYIASPYLSRTCAQWHHDALGYWPGEHRSAETEQFSHEASECATIALVASAALASKAPPRSWFGPQPTKGATAISVDPRTGQLWGYLASWGTCHIGIDGQCVEPPPSKTNYAYFHTGVVDTDEGEIPCGVLTMDTGHADLALNPHAALAHYDNTGKQVARVVAGEDEYGIWVAGQALPIGEGDYARFRASAPSGDWRRIAGNLELVAGLMVNVPGYPVPRPALAASGGVRTALVAVNPVLPAGALGVDVDELATAVVKRMRDGERRASRIRELRRQVNGPRVAALVASVGDEGS